MIQWPNITVSSTCSFINDNSPCRISGEALKLIKFPRWKRFCTTQRAEERRTKHLRLQAINLTKIVGRLLSASVTAMVTLSLLRLDSEFAPASLPKKMTPMEMDSLCKSSCVIRSEDCDLTLGILLENHDVIVVRPRRHCESRQMRLQHHLQFMVFSGCLVSERIIFSGNGTL